MEQTIAIYTTQDGVLDEYFKCNRIDIYKRESSSWSRGLTIPIDYSNKKEPCEIRDHTFEIIEAIGECRVLAGASITGLPFHVFDKKGYYIFDITDTKDETLEALVNDIAQNDYNEKMKMEMIKNAQPVETEITGNYFLDLVALMKACPEVSSKKALIGFLQNKPFMELTLICSHIPPWMEDMGLEIKQNKDSNGNIVAVVSNLPG